MNKAVITLQEYQGFQRAYDFFNRELFADSLPQVLVCFAKKCAVIASKIGRGHKFL